MSNMRPLNIPFITVPKIAQYRTWQNIIQLLLLAMEFTEGIHIKEFGWN